MPEVALPQVGISAAYVLVVEGVDAFASETLLEILVGVEAFVEYESVEIAVDSVDVAFASDASVAVVLAFAAVEIAFAGIASVGIAFAAVASFAVVDYTSSAAVSSVVVPVLTFSLRLFKTLG